MIDWTTVIVASITTAPAILASWLAYSIRREVRTPSGDRLGAVVERAHETGIANNLLLRKLNGHTDHERES